MTSPKGQAPSEQQAADRGQRFGKGPGNWDTGWRARHLPSLKAQGQRCPGHPEAVWGGHTCTPTDGLGQWFSGGPGELGKDADV